MGCVEKIDWEKLRKREGNTVYGGHIIEDKTVSPYLLNELRILHDTIDDLICKQIELEEKIDCIIKSLRGKAEAEYKKSGGL